MMLCHAVSIASFLEGSWKVRKLDTCDMDVKMDVKMVTPCPTGPTVSHAVPSTPKRPSTSSFTWQWNRSINFGNPF